MEHHSVIVNPNPPLKKETVVAVAQRALYTFVTPYENLHVCAHGDGGWKISADVPHEKKELVPGDKSRPVSFSEKIRLTFSWFHYTLENALENV